MSNLHTADHPSISTYVDLLTTMDRVTDELTDAIRALDLPEVGRLLSCRETLCREVTAAHQQLQQADPELGCLTAQIRTMEQTLLAKQSACETAVSQQLQQSRRDLAELHTKKSLRCAYGTPRGTNAPSHFLDNRF